MATLEANEYVVNDGGTYRLSLRYLDLGEAAKGQLRVPDVVREELEELAAESGELVQFATHEHGRAVYLSKARGENAVQTGSSIGSCEYLHCLSLGKAMLARMPVGRWTGSSIATDSRSTRTRPSRPVRRCSTNSRSSASGVRVRPRGEGRGTPLCRGSSDGRRRVARGAQYLGARPSVRGDVLRVRTPGTGHSFRERRRENDQFS